MIEIQAVQLLNFFIIINSFTTELSKQLKEARKEAEDDFVVEQLLTRDKWMILAEMRPSDEEDEFDDIVADENYNWMEHLKNYSQDQLENCSNWIQKQKSQCIQTENNNLPVVTFSQLNLMQKFCYKLVEYFIQQNKQLLLIINGTAGILDHLYTYS